MQARLQNDLLKLPVTAVPGISSVAFSPDGKILAAARKQVQLWDPATGKKRGSLKGHESAASQMAFFPDGKTLVSADFFGLRFWDLANREMLAAVPVQDWIGRLAIAADGQTLALSTKSTLELRDAAGRKTLAKHKLSSECWKLVFSADGKKLAFPSGENIELWTVRPFKSQQTFAWPGMTVYGLDITPDDKVLAAVCREGAIKLWSLDTGQEIGHIERAHEEGAFCVCFSPDGGLLASSGADGLARLWDWQTGRPLAKLPIGPKFNPAMLVTCLAFAPDGQTLAVGGWAPPRLQLWSLGDESKTQAPMPFPEGVEEEPRDPDELIAEVLGKKHLEESDFMALRRIRNVGFLSFGEGCTFAEGGFRHLLKLRHLEGLEFERVALASTDLGYLGQMPHLANLVFRDCPLQDGDVKLLAQSPTIKGLFLNGAQITDAALKEIGGMAQLEGISLDDTAVTDKGLAHLRGLTSLQSLSLCNTAVTDAGILPLAALPCLTLKDADVRGARVTKAGLDAFFQKQQENLKKEEPEAGIDVEESEAARQQLERFFAALNEFEKDSGKWLVEENKRQPNRALAERLRIAEENRLARILTEYCVDVKKVEVACVLRDPVSDRRIRREAGLKGSFKPYYHPEHVRFKSVKAKSSTVLAVLVDVYDYDADSFLHCQFVMKKKEGRWLVDHKRVWDGRWKRTPI